MERSIRQLTVVAASVLLSGAAAYAQSRALVSHPIDESKLVTLAGNTRPEANQANDRGLMADNEPLHGMVLQLRRPPEMEQMASDFVDSLTDPKSPNFHHWLTAAEVGQKFGVAAEDIAKITSWLQSHGFTIDAVSASRMQITFSGNAGNVRSAFHTELHNLSVKGEPHFANMSDPKIPEALAPVVHGVTSLHNFMPKPLSKRINTAQSTFNAGNGYNIIAPSDLAKIYNLNPLFKAGITGKGVSVALLEDTDIYSVDDWNYFRKEMGLARPYPSGTFTIVRPGPGPAGACNDPGINGNEGEAMIDVEWATASAPGANIEMVTCADSSTNFGVFIAIQNILSTGPVPQIMSISYASPETLNGESGNAYITSLYQQASMQGVSIFVASGDWGAAITDVFFGDSAAEFGINENAIATTVYDVAVGGTDFSDLYFGTTNTYWSSTNGPNYESAKSYVPEIPWNDSCGSVLLSEFFGYSEPYGTNGFCNSSTGANFIDIIAGGGGPSGCATGAPSETGVVSGTCKGYDKPKWQSVYGNPADKVRDVPDVALFASNGFLGHYYIFCDTEDQTTCNENPADWPGAGGTSFASPIMAGIQALINQKVGGPQGLPNSIYYAIADSEYGKSGNSACNSALGNAIGTNCVFNDITQDNMDVPCQANSMYGTLIDCYLPSGSYGVLSTSNSSYKPAFPAAPGWDFASGLGSVNATNLVNAYAQYLASASKQ